MRRGVGSTARLTRYLTTAPALCSASGWKAGDTLYHDSYKFANKSGMSLLDYPLYTAVKDVFASNNSFTEIDNILTAENSNFLSPNDLVTFVDNHDQPRLLSINNNTNRLNEATAF